MKLAFTATSPYMRRVTFIVAELGLSDRVAVWRIDHRRVAVPSASFVARPSIRGSALQVSAAKG